MAGLFDTHAHLNDRRLAWRVEEVLWRAREAGVERVLCPGYDLPSSRRAVEFAERYDCVWAAVGVHPHDAGSLTEACAGELAQLAGRPGVVAVGEAGLDYYRDLSPRPVQREAFRRQLDLARRLALPVIIHDRDASEDILRIIEEEGLPPAGGVVHCFSGDAGCARRALGLGLHVGIAGPVTFAKSAGLQEIARTAPLDRLLVETDAPYLTPVPYRGRRDNEPAFVRLVAEKVAELRRMPIEDVAAATTQNALALFTKVR